MPKCSPPRQGPKCSQDSKYSTKRITSKHIKVSKHQPTLSPALYCYILTEYKGKAKIHHPSFSSLEGTNDLHHYILTEYRRKAKLHRPYFANLEGTNDGTPHRYILIEYRAKAKIHRPSSASLEGTNDVSQSCKHQHSLSAKETSSTISSIFQNPSNQRLRQHVHNLLIHGNKLQLHSMPLHHMLTVDCHWYQHQIVDCHWCQQQMLESLYLMMMMCDPCSGHSMMYEWMMMIPLMMVLWWRLHMEMAHILDGPLLRWW